LTALYVPGVEETDPKKLIRSQQLVASATATNTTNIATNATNIATNTTAISCFEGRAAGIRSRCSPIRSGNLNKHYACGHAGTATISSQRRKGVGQVYRQRFKRCPDSYGQLQRLRCYEAATGVYTVSFTTAFSSANYACAGKQDRQRSLTRSFRCKAQERGQRPALDLSNGTAGATAFDPGSGMIVCFGDQ
jgi:hypothetical protein